METPRPRPWSGVAYLVVVALLLGFTVQIYRKQLPWQRTVKVTVVSQAAGLGLNPHSDVKMQGRIVGEVRSVTSDGTQARVTLALDPDETDLIPRDVDAAILPKTLFGEKYVDLRVRAGGGTGRIQDGDQIEQSTTAVELGAIFAKLDPLLRDLAPDKLASIIDALATALDGQGPQIARSIRNLESVLSGLDPQLAGLIDDLRLTGDVGKDYAQVVPDLVAVLEAGTGLSNDLLVPHERAFEELLTETLRASRVAREVLDRNARRIVRLTGESQPLLELLRDYAGALPCFIDGLHTVDKIANQVFASRGPYLDLVIDSFAAHAPYRNPADLPTNPRSDGHDSNLPPTVPNWAPHCPTFRADALALEDVEPFAYVRGAGDPRSSGSPVVTPAPAVAEARRALARLTAARMLGTDPAHIPSYATLLVEPLMSGTLTVP